jgi:hypothetical protein
VTAPIYDVGSNEWWHKNPLNITPVYALLSYVEAQAYISAYEPGSRAYQP